MVAQAIVLSHPFHHAKWAAPFAAPQGGVYTVRDVFDARPYGFDQDGLLLEEIINPVLDYLAPAGPVRIEQFFLAFRFRPLRITSVEVFTRMLWRKAEGRGLGGVLCFSRALEGGHPAIRPTTGSPRKLPDERRGKV